MGKRKADEVKNEEYYLKKIRKMEEKMAKLKDVPSPAPLPSSPPICAPPSPSRSEPQPRPLLRPSPSPSPSPSPPPSPSPSPPPPPPPPRRLPLPAPQPPPSPPEQDLNADEIEDDLPEEFLQALGAEGQEKIEVGEPIRSELAFRWKKLMNDGLGKEAKEAIAKKYPMPSNFTAAVAPILNPEILATLSEPSIKRDKRIVTRQNLTGILLSCLGKSLTNIFKGNINSKLLIEEINDAAKLAAEIHYQDSASRKFFSLAGANKTVQDAVRPAVTDKFLFGADCAEKIKAAQAIKKNSVNLKNIEKKVPAPLPPNKKKQLNWKGPPQQVARARGGQQPKKHYNQPHRDRKDRERSAASYKQRTRPSYRR